MHNYTQNSVLEIKGSSDRIFGLVFSAAFGIFAFHTFIGEGSTYLWSLGIAALFLVMALFTPRLLAPANRLWIKFSMRLHSIFSPVALGILFYLVVTPTALLRRFFGKDSLRLRFDPACESYWIRRPPPGPAAGSFDNQF